jgi:predicted CoA-binding protein
MANESCPLPSDAGPGGAELIAHMLGARRIAVVGASDRPNRPANYVPSYMIEQGYEIIPVNPQYETVWGHKSYKTIVDVPGKVELVNVFRRSEFIPDVVRDAITAGAGGVWVQSGIYSEEAKQLARNAGMPYIEDRCIMMEHMHRRRRG